MNTESFVIVLPLPNKILSPNCTVATVGMRMQKAASIARYRRLACEAIQACGVDTLPWNAVSVQATFAYPTARTRDPDNAIGSLKAAYDGMVDGGLVSNDDYLHMRREPPEFFVDKNCPCVILKITRIR